MTLEGRLPSCLRCVDRAEELGFFLTAPLEGHFGVEPIFNAAHILHVGAVLKELIFRHHLRAFFHTVFKYFCPKGGRCGSRDGETSERGGGALGKKGRSLIFAAPIFGNVVSIMLGFDTGIGAPFSVSPCPYPLCCSVYFLASTTLPTSY